MSSLFVARALSELWSFCSYLFAYDVVFVVYGRRVAGRGQRVPESSLGTVDSHHINLNVR